MQLAHLHALYQKQHQHPPIEQHPCINEIQDTDGLLFIGTAAAVSRAVLEDYNISAILALGVDQLNDANTTLRQDSNIEAYACYPDFLDLSTSNLFSIVQACLDFLKLQMLTYHRKVLVHCVYGQSRSASMCIAYLMNLHQSDFITAYDLVLRSRPCIYINQGFIYQLVLWEKMNRQLDGQSQAHAQYRTMMFFTEKRLITTGVERNDSSHSNVLRYSCQKCRQTLCTSQNIIPHESIYLKWLHLNQNQKKSTSSVCSNVWIEPMEWMNISVYGTTGSNKIYCPNRNCQIKIGSWNVHGNECSCGTFIRPLCQLSASRIDQTPMAMVSKSSRRT